VLENWEHVRPLVNQLKQDGSCPSSTSALATALDGDGEDIGEFALHLQFAALKDVGSKLIKATYALEGERLELLVAHRRIKEVRAFGTALKLLLEQIKGVLNGTFTEAPSAINRQLLPTVSKLVRDNLTPRKGMRLAKKFGRDRFYAIVADDGDEVLDPDEPGKTTMQFHVVYTDGDEETMTTKEVKEHYAEFTDDMYISNLEALVPAFDYLESRLTGTCRSESHSCVESLNIAR
jgi:hypothetical protein